MNRKEKYQMPDVSITVIHRILKAAYIQKSIPKKEIEIGRNETFQCTSTYKLYIRINPRTHVIQLYDQYVCR